MTLTMFERLDYMFHGISDTDEILAGSYECGRGYLFILATCMNVCMIYFQYKLMLCIYFVSGKHHFLDYATNLSILKIL